MFSYIQACNVDNCDSGYGGFSQQMKEEELFLSQDVTLYMDDSYSTYCTII